MSIADFFRTSRKRKTIGLYLTRLGPILQRRYGKSSHYTPAQVEQVAREAKLPMGDLCYGLSIYCTAGDFDDYHAAHGEECNYWKMRVEVGEHHFHGNSAFTQQDVVAHSEAYAHSHTGSDTGGGHHFDGGGGGYHGGH